MVMEPEGSQGDQGEGEAQAEAQAEAEGEGGSQRFGSDLGRFSGC